jgi:hypothetical protein
MGTGKRRINSGVRVLVAQAALVIAWVAPGVPVAQEALAGLAAQVALAELVVRVAPAGPELETVPAVVEQEPAPVAAAQELAPVAVEPEHDLAVAELEPDRAEAALAPGHPRGQPGVVPRTKSVTAAHRRDLVLRLAAEDLAAAVAGTTREPAAAEAVIAWEVAE